MYLTRNQDDDLYSIKSRRLYTNQLYYLIENGIVMHQLDGPQDTKIKTSI